MNIRNRGILPLLITLLMFSLISISCSSSAGEPEPTVGSIEATTEAGSEATATPPLPTLEAPATEVPAEEAGACLEPTAETQLLKDEANGFCFLYPLEYDVFESDDGSITLYQDSLMSVEAPTFTIWVSAAAGRTAEQLADEATRDLPADFGHTRGEATLAGEPAVVLDNMPGQDLNRRLFAIHDGRLYDLIVNRIGPDYGEIGQQAEMLFEMILDSFRFVSTVPDAPLEAGRECPPEIEGTVLLRNEEHGYCLLYPAGYTAEQPVEGETVIYVDSLMNVEDPKLFINVEAAESRTAQEVVDGLVAEFETAMPESGIERSFGLMVDGVFAEEVDNVPGQDLSRQVIVVRDDLLYRLTFVPSDEAAGEVFTEMESLYELVIFSLSFLDS
jgi:hypothetical protein